MSLAMRLNQRVTIQQQSTAVDEIGQPVVSWSDVATVWAEVKDVSGREYIAAGAEQSAVLTKITIRQRDGIVSAMRVLHGSDTYGIDAVLESDRTMLLMCKRSA